MVESKKKISYSCKRRIYFKWSWVVSAHKLPVRHKHKRNVDLSQGSGILLDQGFSKDNTEQIEETRALEWEAVARGDCRNTHKRPWVFGWSGGESLMCVQNGKG